MTKASSVVKGIFLLVRGRPEGINEFGNTLNAFTASIAPLIAFPLVGAVILGMNGQPQAAILAFLSRLCGVLALSAITHFYAKRTGREALWLRTATALNWSFWVIIPLLLVAAFIGALLVTGGAAEAMAENIVIGMIAGYMLWYHWFTVRSGLKLGVLSAILLVLITNIAVGLMTLGPDLINLLITKS